MRGPIPAQAGEPTAVPWFLRLARAYPRAGGGTGPESQQFARHPGLSPRRRGNPAPDAGKGPRGGPIPAQAGEPPTRTCARWASGAYPRAGGGTPKEVAMPDRAPGLSPRRRGNLFQLAVSVHPPGPIPAQAGEPPTGGTRSCRSRAYPRAGGGTEQVRLRHRALQGLSPRRRGNRDGSALDGRDLGPIPAQAGEPRTRRRRAA